MTFIFLILAGLAVGSFLGMLTYRLPRGLSLKGRSYCDHCGKKISWTENIPVISYMLLLGKCKNCKRNISGRYPIIEISTGILFVLTYYLYSLQTDHFVYYIKEIFGGFGVVFLLVLVSLFFALLITDLETQLLPDSLLLILGILAFFLFNLNLPSPLFFEHIFWGFVASMFFLSIYLITRERGLGFGDVKLAFVIGLILGFPHTLVWILLSFVGGSVVGVLLLLFRVVKIGSPLPFGPFLITSSYITLFFGASLFVWYIQLLAP